MANKPTLALIPSAYKTSKVYSVLPNNGSGDFTFDRTSSATRVNKDGLIETVASNIPRLDYSDGSCPSLLLEPQRTNSIPYSEEFDGNWVIASSLINDNYDISPNGELNACRLIDNGSGGAGSIAIYKGFALTSDTTYTFSVFAKKDQVNFTSLRTESFSSPLNGNSYFDLENGTLGSINPDHEAKIEDYGNGWYRCSITFTVSGADTTGLLYIYANEQNNIPTSQRDGTTSVLLYGVQLEEGNYPTSYIPTTGSTVTRLADNCYGAGDSNLFNDSEGVLYVETEQFIDGDFQSVYISLSQGTSITNHLTIQHRDSGQLRVYANGFGTADIQFLENIDFAQNLKIAIQYKINDYKLFVNGAKYSIYALGGTQPTLTGLNALQFNLNTSTSNNWLGKVKDLRVYNEALTDTELTELTSL